MIIAVKLEQVIYFFEIMQKIKFILPQSCDKD